MGRLILIGSAALVFIFVLLHLRSPDNLKTREMPSLHTASVPRVLANPVDNSSPANQTTFNDIMDGSSIEVADRELRDWIRKNRDSESAWLVAYSYRWTHHMNEWLAAGLKSHPDSLPLVLSAANADLMAIHQGTGNSRKWIDHFRAIDSDNSLSWLFSALAEYYQGNFEKGDAHWIRASKQRKMRFYSSHFEEASYEFGLDRSNSEAIAFLMGDSASPSLRIPKFMDTIREIQSRSDVLREAGLLEEADKLDIAGYKLGNLFFNRDITDNGWAIYPSMGIQLNKNFRDRIPLDIVLGNSEVEQRMEAFKQTWQSYRNRKNIPGGEGPNESGYLAWSYVRQLAGETAALDLLPNY